MPLISPTLKTIVEAIPGTVYMRNSEIEANIDADQIDLDGKTLVIYYNMPDVEHIQGALTLRRDWPVEILVVELAEMDDDGDDGDVIRARCLAVADKIYDGLSLSQISSAVQKVEGYNVSFEETVKIFDKVLTGCRLRMTMPLDRADGLCATVTTPEIDPDLIWGAVIDGAGSYIEVPYNAAFEVANWRAEIGYVGTGVGAIQFPFVIQGERRALVNDQQGINARIEGIQNPGDTGFFAIDSGTTRGSGEDGLMRIAGDGGPPSDLTMYNGAIHEIAYSYLGIANLSARVRRWNVDDSKISRAGFINLTGTPIVWPAGVTSLIGAGRQQDPPGVLTNFEGFILYFRFYELDALGNDVAELMRFDFSEDVLNKGADAPAGTNGAWVGTERYQNMTQWLGTQ